jgi:hypothetical protein
VENRRVLVECVARVGDHLERLVVDLDELGRVAGRLACVRHDRSDGLADEARLPDGEAEVLQVRARGRRDLEERVGQQGDLVACERPVHTGVLERLRDVDRSDLGVGVRRANEVDVAHVVALDVVEEEALALDEPLVLLARDVLAGPAAPGLALLDDDRLGGSDGRLGHSPTSCPEAALMAVTMFQ